jgi:hypothetical protein
LIRRAENQGRARQKNAPNDDAPPTFQPPNALFALRRRFSPILRRPVAARFRDRRFDRRFPDARPIRNPRRDAGEKFSFFLPEMRRAFSRHVDFSSFFVKI